MGEEELIEMIVGTKKWYDSRIESLRMIAEKEDFKIKFANTEGEQVELPEEDRRGFMIGIKVALEVLGEFPISITK